MDLSWLLIWISSTTTGHVKARRGLYTVTGTRHPPSGVYTNNDDKKMMSKKSSAPSDQPSSVPTSQPSVSPTGHPTNSPTLSPTRFPTIEPTLSPTQFPTREPTLNPTRSPTRNPTPSPTRSPTSFPTPSPSSRPTQRPTLSPSSPPSGEPTWRPPPSQTSEPTGSATHFPATASTLATDAASGSPSSSLAPTEPGEPTWHPSSSQTSEPTNRVTYLPTTVSTASGSPSASPSPTEFGGMDVMLPPLRLVFTLSQGRRRSLEVTTDALSAAPIEDAVKIVLTEFLSTGSGGSLLESVTVQAQIDESTPAASVTGSAFYRGDPVEIPSPGTLRDRLTTYFSFLGTDNLQDQLLAAGVPMESLTVQVDGVTANSLISESGRSIENGSDNGPSTTNLAVGAIVVAVGAAFLGVVALGLFRRRPGGPASRSSPAASQEDTPEPAFLHASSLMKPQGSSSFGERKVCLSGMDTSIDERVTGLGDLESFDELSYSAHLEY